MRADTSGEGGGKPLLPVGICGLAGLIGAAAILRPTQYQPVSCKIMRGVAACFHRLRNTMETTPWTSTA
ncbi:hypothetical protein BOSE62_130866 [Bosea sp. 62]|nr:hypothetical protein BOSE7B_120898 [Bosea sp. 7B]CAD5273062.1 hypothetical protein BOSE21B_30014 [Bosea sp. 21B]CAD5285051.1 hypothetical protein BOSE46_50232 [Bosea sp. 46]VVT60248.1 hypothetical protein BOS5A_211039 [Bosea sp. EC-HK365B]VXB60842.1 hypothetical protein BOSE62_130866 [Bosea sp. 62]VXC09595.1 hypothetical protein BOSE29B_30014 [Bosea sp. 29B]VXC22965.1 hypothetical protein BOSE127_170537 [Bosea sp. 127]VXC62845.1 hypothetical protein BOSE125_30395 [Bosea sp. 125]